MLATLSNVDKVHSALYVKDKYSLSDTGFHELSMLSDLPKSSQITKLAYELTINFIFIMLPMELLAFNKV